MARFTLGRGLAVTISAAAAVALLAGCTAGTDGGAGNPGIRAKSSPSAAATSEGVKVTGDLEAQDSKITDSLGEYTPVKLREDSDALKIPESLVDFTNGGSYSKAKAVEAGQWVARLAGSDLIDSVALDTGEPGWNEWKQNRADLFVSELGKESVLGPIAEGDVVGQRSLVVLATPANGQFPQMVRDGGPRVTSGTVKVDGIQSAVGDGGTGLVVTGTTKASYRVLSSKAKELMKRVSPKNTDEIMEPYYPDMYSKEIIPFELTDTWSYSVYMEAGEWKIYNYYNKWQGDFKHDSKAGATPTPEAD